jgi:CheY-like chemotaxis protein
MQLIRIFDSDENYLLEKDSFGVEVFDWELPASKKTEYKSDDVFVYDFLYSHLGNGDYLSCPILIDPGISIQLASLVIIFLRTNNLFKCQDSLIIYEYLLDDLLGNLTSTDKYHLPSKNTVYQEFGDYKDEQDRIGRLTDLIQKSANISQDTDLSKIHFLPPTSSRHQGANEWGAYALLYDSGFHNLFNQLLEQHVYYKSLYFSYLKAKSGKNNLIAESEIRIDDTVGEEQALLIDDNYDLGWHFLFDEILRRTEAKLTVATFEEVKRVSVENENEITTRLLRHISENNFKCILLDLRLTESDNNPDKSNVLINSYTGGRLLKAIKEAFPYLPVIMVTASNKAWNMQQLIDAGADGYFIKEDPENIPNPEVSRINYRNFISLIKDCKTKHNRLAPYWKLIKKIEQGNTLIRVKSMESGGRTKIEARLIERLKMFFGLLKRAHEDSAFNRQKFYYSDFKLAFMTLWSCLNDIQHCYLVVAPNKKTIKIRPELELESGGEVKKYLTKEFNNSPKIRASLKENWNIRSYEFFEGTLQEPSKKLDKSIGEQIAFIVSILSEGNRSLRNSLSQNLFELKDIRNKLYLTHGDESPNSEFFHKLEQEQEEIVTNHHCAELFEIVYFLITGTFASLPRFAV